MGTRAKGGERERRGPHIELQPVIAIDRKAKARWGGPRFKPSERLVLTPKGERWVVRGIWLGIAGALIGWLAFLAGMAILVYNVNFK